MFKKINGDTMPINDYTGDVLYGKHSSRTSPRRCLLLFYRYYMTIGGIKSKNQGLKAELQADGPDAQYDAY